MGTRIGDKISLSGVSFKTMLELNERYSDVTFRMMVVRSAKGDIPDGNTLWQGNLGNKMLDTFNTERYSVIFTKYVKMRAPNMGIQSTGVQQIGSGFASGTPHLSCATRIVKFYVPDKKFTRSGVLQYENVSTQTKFFDYLFMMCVCV